MDVYKRIIKLGYEIPALPPRGGIYKPVRQVGNMLYISGQGSTLEGIPEICGKLGTERSIEEGQAAARLCVLNAISYLHDYIGDLNRIKSVVKTLAFVSSGNNFNDQPKVIDGASQLLLDIFGEDAGVGARSAIGVNELPGNISVEIEFIFELQC